MDKKKIIIKGKRVQDIGYRVFLLTNALNFDIDYFYAYNMIIENMQAVIVRIEVENEIIYKYYNYIKDNIPDDAMVSAFEIEEFTGKVMDINKYLHLVQVEQLNKGIDAILDIRENTKKTLEKQDTKIQVLQEVKHDTSAIKSTLSRIQAAQAVHEAQEA